MVLCLFSQARSLPSEVSASCHLLLSSLFLVVHISCGLTTAAGAGRSLEFCPNRYGECMRSICAVSTGAGFSPSEPGCRVGPFSPGTPTCRGVFISSWCSSLAFLRASSSAARSFSNLALSSLVLMSLFSYSIMCKDSQSLCFLRSRVNSFQFLLNIESSSASRRFQASFSNLRRSSSAFISASFCLICSCSAFSCSIAASRALVSG